jgi:hypothetical protein
MATDPKITACEKIQIPATSGVKHFSLLQSTPEISADITGSSKGIKSTAARNGSALWYNGQGNDTGQASYIGIFKDNLPKPNIYYFLDLNSPKAKTFFEKNIINGGKGTTNFVLSKRYTHPDGFAEKLRDPAFFSTLDYGNRVLNKYDFPLRVFPVEDYPFFAELYSSNPRSGFTTLQDGTAMINPLALMKFAQEKAYNWNRPIVFCINSVNVAALNVTSSALMSFQIITKILPVFGAAAEVTADLLSKALNTYIAISSKGLNADNGMTLVSCLAQMADMIAPETVKGARDFVNGNIGTLLNFAKQSSKDLFTLIDPYTNPKTFSDIAAKLNTSVSYVKGIYDTYTDDATGYAKIVSSFSGDQFNNAKNILANFKNIALIDHANRAAKQAQGTASLLEQQITSTRNINQIPILRDLFVAGSANTILPTLPNADNIVKSVIANHQEEITKYGDKGKQMEAMITTISMGYTPPSQVFDEFAINALKAEANKANTAGQKFVFPDSIPEDKKDCYVYELESQGFDMIPCRTGEIWDHSKRKCVMQNASISVTSDIFSKQNLLIAGGIVAAGLIAKKMK